MWRKASIGLIRRTLNLLNESDQVHGTLELDFAFLSVQVVQLEGMRTLDFTGSLEVEEESTFDKAIVLYRSGRYLTILFDYIEYF